MKLQSDFAMLDVKRGRKQLEKHFKSRPRMGPCPQDMRIPVTITGYIEGQHGSDDGTSIEFTVIVEDVTVCPPPPSSKEGE